jgi:hypothetical protein
MDSVSPFQRKSPRRALDVPCGVLHAGGYGISRVHQIGEGGVLVESSLPVAIGDQVTVTLKIPNAGYFCTRLNVLNINHRDGSARFGASFVNLPLKAKRWIRAYVAAKTEKEADMDFLSNNQ